ncbi:MAG: hypothetical protein HGA33_00790 [Candidatus Moranbacteria bacterium]|nr:hypothetical protein [Candidatus Moranbacteria bacterium]
MPDFGTTTTSIKYKTRALQRMYLRSMYMEVVNSDFEAANVSDKKLKKKITKTQKEFVVTTLTGGGWKSTDGKTINYTTVQEVISRLVIDTPLQLADEIPSIDAFASAVEDPDSQLIKDAGDALYEELDKSLLSMYDDAAAGNWLGVSYVTGTVTVTATTGAVVGVGTTFAADMVGKPFKAEGHEDYYRVKTFTDTTHITIEDDSDDKTSAYTGGAISAGAGFEIQANTAADITVDNIKFHLDTLAAMLTNRKVPNDKSRWLALPVSYAQPVLLGAAAVLGQGIGKVYDEATEKGEIARISGFRIFMLPDAWFDGNNTDGFYCVGGHQSFITAGFDFIEDPHVVESKTVKDSNSDFVKGLFVHGEKVADIRRTSGVCLFATFNQE